MITRLHLWKFSKATLKMSENSTRKLIKTVLPTVHAFSSQDELNRAFKKLKLVVFHSVILETLISIHPN